MTSHLLTKSRVSTGLLALFLAACGGGSGTTSTTATTPSPAPSPAPAPAPAPAVGALSGVFSDGPVQGANFSTTSGVTGTTDAQGRFTYNAGDKVTFTLGTLSLGTTTASALVTPLSLAAGDTTRMVNTLVLLQSLDTDGVPGNGITIAAAAANAVGASVSLTQSTATFASAANGGLAAAMAAGGITRSVTSVGSATSHFASQGLSFLSNNVLAVDNGTNAAMIRFGATGEYLLGTAEPNNFCGANGQCGTTLISRAGVENGSYRVTGISAAGYQIAASPVIDTNLQGGLSHPAACDSGFLPDGDGIISNGTCADSGGRIGKAPNVASGIVGVWALGSATTIRTQHFAFFPSGRYLMTDPLGDTEGKGCGGPGVEFGNYAYDTTSRKLTVSGLLYDTNLCAGLNDTTNTARNFSGTFTLAADGKTLAVLETPTSTPVTLYRVSK